ncbi:hypothetical protein [Thiospirillum jenense]|uniref:Glycosyltransferase RgtA/B/C/D-like domain-containing protein n=1 Tax=Thiospirillum jenense TaxID=1653858 RepID=A0A839HLL8_9GAMM|nr:hypothetical protein [Thiospirillum jenense]MBB1127199.1 hypothetical protein [Thiospirillum jenense]
MIDTIASIIGLGLPWLFGALVLRLLIPVTPLGRGVLIAGYGYLVGIIASTVLLRALSASGVGFSLIAVLFTILPLFALLIWANYRWSAAITTPRLSDEWLTLTAWQWVLIIGLCSLIVLRFYHLALEVWWRPLFGWDATMHWATKTRVFTEWQQLMPFVNYDVWLTQPADRVFTDPHPNYPLTIPLMQTWMNVFIGEYNDHLMNLPWLGAYIALGLLLAGQLRALGSSLITTAIFTYFLLSLPLLNTHIALAGYADVWVGIYYFAALLAFYQWATTGQRWQLGLAVMTALVLPLLKNEGLFWLVTFIPALAALWLPARRLFILLGSATIAGALLIWLLPADMMIAGHRLAELNLGWRFDAFLPVLRSLFLFDSWHLLYWLAMGLLVINIAQRQQWARPFIAVSFALFTGYGLFFLLFLTTNYANAAAGDTSVSRIALHLAPATVFWTWLLFQQVSQTSAVYSADPACNKSFC